VKRWYVAQSGNHIAVADGLYGNKSHERMGLHVDAHNSGMAHRVCDSLNALEDIIQKQSKCPHMARQDRGDGTWVIFQFKGKDPTFPCCPLCGKEF
jgi:hypothetical protein